jgi:microcystin-dependent protein
LTISELPAHTHAVSAMPGTADQLDPTGRVWAGGHSAYAPSATTTMNAASVGSSGGSLPHENQSPYLVLNFCIALQGQFPTQS